MKIKITYDQFRKMLTDLDFTEHHVPGSHIYFDHPPSGTLLGYREYKPADIVNLGDVISARKFLVERGILEDEDEFEDVLRKYLDNGKSSD